MRGHPHGARQQRILGGQQDIIASGYSGSAFQVNGLAGFAARQGVHEDDPQAYDKRKVTDLLAPGESKLPETGIGDDDLNHMQNWFECLRSREQPHATVHNGLAHSAACIMAARSYHEGRRFYWDAKSENIVDSRPSAT
jgi:hypothetical protein